MTYRMACELALACGTLGGVDSVTIDVVPALCCRPSWTMASTTTCPRTPATCRWSCLWAPMVGVTVSELGKWKTLFVWMSVTSDYDVLNLHSVAYLSMPACASDSRMLAQ